MSEDNSVDTDPSALEPTDASIYAKQVAPRQRQKPSTAMWLGLGALVILALAVVFVLPSVVTEYELPLEVFSTSFSFFETLNQATVFIPSFLNA